jgi:hypothetical protein
VQEDSQFFGSFTVKMKAERLTLECLTASEEPNSQTYIILYAVRLKAYQPILHPILFSWRLKEPSWHDSGLQDNYIIMSATVVFLILEQRNLTVTEPQGTEICFRHRQVPFNTDT